MSRDAEDNQSRLPGFSLWQASMPEARPREGFWHFKHEDTIILLVVASLYALLLMGVVLIWGASGWPVALGLLLVAILIVQLNLNRLRQKNEEQQLRSLQALESLHELLPLRAPLPALSGWAASPELALTIVQLINLRKPAHIVEFGSGASTIVMAYALEANESGQLHAFEHSQEFARVSKRMVSEHRMEDRASIHHAPLRTFDRANHDGRWYDVAVVSEVLQESSPVDLLLIDGPPKEVHSAARYPAFPVVEPYLSDDAVIVMDDATRKGEQHALKRWLAGSPGWQVEWHRSPKGTAILYREDT